jgi:glycosyltransferase involved in cell wall biosynthesis
VGLKNHCIGNPAGLHGAAVHIGCRRASLYTGAVRIAIDTRRIRDFGVGTYIRNVVRMLGRIDRQNEYLLVGPAEPLREIGELPPNFLNAPYSLPDTSARNYFQFQGILRKFRCEVLHVPHLFSSPQFIPCRYVVTVHDLLEHFYPPPGESATRRSLRFYFTRRVLRRAERIFAVSNSTRNDIGQFFHIPLGKVEVIYNAIDERFRRGHTTEADRQLIAGRYLVNYPFLLYAGNIRPHKNVIRIIEAFSALKTELEKEGRFPDLKLIIIGDELSKHPDLRRAVVRSGVTNDVRFFGFVPIDVLRIFYDTAQVFVFPSLYEGFGLPPLEAMAHGTPVVTSNTSSLPEVVGNAAVLVNPENVFDIMHALHRVLLDQPLRERLKRAGYQQSLAYSWESSVERIRQVYEEVAHHGSVAAGQRLARSNP